METIQISQSKSLTFWDLDRRLRRASFMTTPIMIIHIVNAATLIYCDSVACAADCRSGTAVCDTVAHPRVHTQAPPKFR